MKSLQAVSLGVGSLAVAGTAAPADALDAPKARAGLTGDMTEVSERSGLRGQR
ncbi:hypothetical protein ACIBO6_25920 [Streptomyces luteogriseus]|uniref:hypothetical protein n=1 Tax=Streptomyces luteogriseus TaxID=68233 RepID=UPI0037B5A27F